MKQILHTEHAPQAIGPYSQGVMSGNFLFLSGQIALSASGECLTEKSPAAQTEVIMNNILRLLSAAGLAFEDVVKTTIFLTDMDDFAAVNAVYGSFFPENAPARSTVAVAALPKNAAVEIECVAQKTE